MSQKSLATFEQGLEIIRMLVDGRIDAERANDLIHPKLQFGARGFQTIDLTMYAWPDVPEDRADKLRTLFRRLAGWKPQLRPAEAKTMRERSNAIFPWDRSITVEAVTIKQIEKGCLCWSNFNENGVPGWSCAGDFELHDDVSNSLLPYRKSLEIFESIRRAQGSDLYKNRTFLDAMEASLTVDEIHGLLSKAAYVLDSLICNIWESTQSSLFCVLYDEIGRIMQNDAQLDNLLELWFQGHYPLGFDDSRVYVLVAE